MHLLRNAKTSEEFLQVCRQAEAILAAHSDDEHCLACENLAAGVFIESAPHLNDPLLAEKGITLLESLLTDLSTLVPEMQDELQYNLSNGYGAISLLLSRDGREQEAQTAREQQKQLLQNLLLREKELAPDLYHTAATNYAVILASEGRLIEAIDQYILIYSKYPDQAVAIGSCAREIKDFMVTLGIFHKANVQEAWQLANAACHMKDEVLSLGSIQLLDGYCSLRENLEKEIAPLILDEGAAELGSWPSSRDASALDDYEPTSLRRRMKADRLLLTLIQNPHELTTDTMDNLLLDYFVGGCPVTDIGTSPQLLALLNEIVESYATARFLFYLWSNDNVLEQEPLLTYYAGDWDAHASGLPGGLLKASFRMAADCFDKIAVALNFYFELGVDERKVYFHSVWHRARKPQSELDGLRELNPFLNALYHMLSDSPAPDWPTNSSLRRVRHQLTHRNHLLHWREEEVESPRESTVTAFRQKTLFLLRNTKAAIIYLVCALILAEQGESEMRRVDESPRLLPVSPSSLRWYDWFTEDDEQES